MSPCNGDNYQAPDAASRYSRILHSKSGERGAVTHTDSWSTKCRGGHPARSSVGARVQRRFEVSQAWAEVLLWDGGEDGGGRLEAGGDVEVL